MQFPVAKQKHRMRKKKKNEIKLHYYLNTRGASCLCIRSSPPCFSILALASDEASRSLSGHAPISISPCLSTAWRTSPNSFYRHVHLTTSACFHAGPGEASPRRAPLGHPPVGAHDHCACTSTSAVVLIRFW